MIAVVLAGTAEENELTEQTGARNKSFINLGGETVLGYVLRALQQAEDVTDICVVGPPEDLKFLQEKYSFRIVKERGTIAENIYAAYEEGIASEYFLLVTGDLPLLSPEAMADFLQQCKPYDLDFYYSIVPKEVVEGSYPGVKRTYISLREGTFTGGNIFLVRTEKLPAKLPHVEEFIRLRKSPAKMILKLGIPFLIKIFTKTLTIAELTKRVQKFMGIKGKAAITCYPEIGTDLDKPSDLNFFQELLENEGKR